MKLSTTRIKFGQLQFAVRCCGRPLQQSGHARRGRACARPRRFSQNSVEASHDSGYSSIPPACLVADVQLRLMQRGAEFSMRLGQNELMSSRLSGSEEASPRSPAEESNRPSARIYDRRAGHGFHPARRACRAGSDARIMVAELCPP